MKCLFAFLLVFLTVSCAGRPPFLEYTLANSAIKAADKVKARHHAAPEWMKALNYYDRGRRHYADRGYISAKRMFNLSLKWAEQAENFSRIKIQSGGGL